MKQANHVFEKVTKYAIRKLSVGVGPVAIGTFLLAGGLFVSKPVSADQVTSDASVHMAYVTENELTAEEQKQVVHAIPKEYQNEDTFYLVYKRKGDSQATLPQTGSSDWAATGLGLATATMAVLLFSKNIVKNYWLGLDWGRRAKSPCADRGSCLAKQGVAGL